MRRLVVILIISFCFSFCTTTHTHCFNECLINLISSEDPNFPSLFSRYSFFCQGGDNKILRLDVRELKEIYDESAFEGDYKTFLTKALNQQIVWDDKHRHIFYLDKNIIQEYQTKEFVDFLLVYFKRNGNDRYLLNRKVDENQRNTIFYFLFINNYLTVFDDYAGFYYAFPISSLTRNLCQEN